MKSLRYCYVGTTFVAVQNATPVDDAEWAAMSRAAASPDSTGFLVWTTGLPTAAQRNRLRTDLSARAAGLPPLACMIDPTLAKTMSYVFELFWGSRFKLFVPTDFEGALQHAGVPSPRRDEARTTIARYRAALGIGGQPS